jgi:hypothetical protein
MVLPAGRAQPVPTEPQISNFFVTKHRVSGTRMTTGQSFMIELAGRELAAMDFGGYSDPYFIVYLVLPSGKRCKLYTSEILMTTLNPDWQPRVLCVHMLCTVRETKKNNAPVVFAGLLMVAVVLKLKSRSKYGTGIGGHLMTGLDRCA